MTLYAEVMDDHLVVVDTDGGVWWPLEEAAAEIEAAEDPAQAAVEMSQAAPMRGVWKQ